MSFLAFILLIIWFFLPLCRGWFWKIEGSKVLATPQAWPAIVAVIPARNEAFGIGLTIRSLLAQKYPGGLKILVVDDNSEDGTAAIAKQSAEAFGASDRLRVIQGTALPTGWTGKVWAMEQGFRAVSGWADEATYILFSDADIEHAPDQVRGLVGTALDLKAVLVSAMVRLNCETLAEKLYIPAFVYFFRLLYPFRWIANPRRRTAGAAGGIMLVNREALKAAGGMGGLKGAMIDDCSLAKHLKERGGTIWLELALKTRSTRIYHNWRPIWDMIARSAFSQLEYSWGLLFLTFIGMSLIFIAPPFLILLAWTSPAAAIMGAVAYGLMTYTYLPVVLYYKLPWWWAFTLPFVSIFYLGATLYSGFAHAMGQGGQWKGRTRGGLKLD